ncbi:MAG: YicC/YloC family endoribonuclease [Terriglobia bacterium]
MTGYSESRVEEAEFSLAASLKSTNHRFLDIHLRLSAGLEFFEPPARRLLKEALLRGHVELVLNLERIGQAALQVDGSLVKAYLDACREIRQEHGFSAEPDLVAILRIPGVVTGVCNFASGEREKLEKLATRALAEAIERLNQARAREGDALARDLCARLDRLEQLGNTVQQLSGSLLPAFRARIEKRLRELTLAQPLEPSRVSQEAAALTLRADIAEEVTRFRTHVQQAKRILAVGGEVGKQLDFLLQEMNREANTMLSKTTDVPGVGMQIADSTIEIKMEAEKIREQIQNIE